MNYDSTYGNEGYSDAKRTLDLADDAVSANLGGSWRMPTVDEYLELRNTSNCDWTWNENYQGSGVSGYVVTSKKEGYTDQSIFLPAAFILPVRNASETSAHCRSFAAFSACCLASNSVGASIAHCPP